MKLKSILWLCFIAFTSNLVAQAPDVINYQAIVRDVNNTVIANQSVSVKFVITEGFATGTVIYEEDQSPTTNSHGLINLKIGTGAFIVGTLATIDWSANSYYLTTSIDPTGGANYSLSGTSELVSVPYALHAKTVDNADDADADPTNEIQDLQLIGNDLSITNNGTATLIDLSMFTTDTDTQLSEADVDAFVANNGYITTEVDGSITNEIELPTGGTNGQVLKTNGSGVYAWVNQADDADADPNNEIELPTGGTSGQVLRTNGSGAYTWVNQADDADADPNNEIELPTGGTNGQVLATNGSGVYTWVAQTTDTDTQLSEAAVDGFVANNGYLATEVDGDITNEIQTLSISGSDLTISGTGGNTVTLPSGATGYKIGQQLQGGTIVFVDSTGIHGLIVANEDLAGLYAYQTTTNDVNGAEDYRDGKGNTDALIADGGTFPAATAAIAYAPTGYTAGDWYLPAALEFNLIYMNAHMLPGLNYTLGLYWTSTQDGGGSNSSMYALTGAITPNFTSTSAFVLVRPMRQF